MDSEKRAKLKKTGARVVSVQELLRLDDEDMAVIEARLVLSAGVRVGRTARGLTQSQLAKAVGSSQARIAKMEGGDPQASLESMIRALAAVGSRVKIAVVPARRVAKRSV